MSQGASRGGALPLAGLTIAIVAAGLAYAPALGGGFHWDDEPAVLWKPTVLEPSRLGWRDFVPPALGRDRPLTDLTFALNHAWSGASAGPYLATNVAIHLLAAVLAFHLVRLVLRRWGHPRADALAAFSAALFALHPMQTEAVSYVSQRSESLASALVLLALLLWLRAAERHPAGRWRGWALAGVLAFLLALAAKAVAITAPILLLAVLVLTGPVRSRGGKYWAVVAAPLAVAAAIGVATVRALGGAKDAGLDAGDLGPWRYLLTQASVLPRYLALLLWPPGQSVDHAVRASPGIAETRTLAGIALLAILLAAALALGRAGRRSGNGAARAAAAGILWFFVVLGPTSSLVPLADPMAEHRTYLANLGLFVAASVGLDEVVWRFLPGVAAARAAAVLAAAALAVLGSALLARNLVWRDDLALWADAARKAPFYYRPALHEGNALWRVGRREEALDRYRRAARLVPPGDGQWAPVHRALGDALASAGRLPEAISALEAAATRVPSHLGLREALAWARYESGDLDGALQEAWRGRALGPASPELAAVIGKVAANRGDVATALVELGRAVELAPRSSQRRADLAIVARMAGQGARACAELARFLGLEGDPAARLEGEKLSAAWGCPSR